VDTDIDGWNELNIFIHAQNLHGSECKDPGPVTDSFYLNKLIVGP